MTNDSARLPTRASEMPGMHLKTLTLMNMRSYRRAQIDVDVRPVAIWGPNGAGKTNILEAISLLSPGRGFRHAAAADICRRPDAPGWKIHAELQAPDRLHEVETSSAASAARRVRIDEKPASQIGLGRIAQILWLLPSMDRLWIEGADGRRRFLDRMALSFNAGHAAAALVYEKAMRERNRLIREQVRDPAWYSALEAQMATSGHQLHQGRCIALEQVRAAQAQAQTAFPVVELALLQSEGEMPATEDALRDALAESRFRDMVAGRALVGPHRTDLHGSYAARGVPARDCSTGEQKALLVSLILSNARALAARSGAAPILLLDEIAAHLDGGRRAALFEELCALGAQAWMTGTGPELFAGLEDRAQSLVVSEGPAGSEVSPA